jgi:hypothetical protein
MIFNTYVTLSYSGGLLYNTESTYSGVVGMSFIEKPPNADFLTGEGVIYFVVSSVFYDAIPIPSTDC